MLPQPVDIREGLYLELRVDDYSYGGANNADHWISFHIWDNDRMIPGNTKDYGQGWLSLIRTGSGKHTVQSIQSGYLQFEQLGGMDSITPATDQNGKNIYTLEIRYTGSGYKILVCGYEVGGCDVISQHLSTLNPNGEFYIGVTFHSGVQNGVCDATVLKFGSTKETATTPQGNEAVAPQASQPHVHTEEINPGMAPTCTQDGYSEEIRCSSCGELLKSREIIPATGHTVIQKPGKAPTCTEGGLSDGESCQACGEILVPQYFLEPTGHDEQVIPGVEPTPTEDGLSDGIVCSACGEILVPQEKIPALGEDEEIILPPADVWDGSVASGFAGGNGTEGNPYLISTGAQLAYLETVAYKEGYSDKHYKLTNPIDLNGLEWEPISMSGYDFYFDGNGYTVSNFKITKKNRSYAGLFSEVGRGTVANLGVTDFEINVTSSYESYAGGLAGYLYWSTIENCYAIGSVTLTSGAETVMVGGLVGYAQDTDAIRGCYSAGTVSGTSKQAYAYAGGLVGKTWSKYSSRTTLENNYSTAQVTAESNQKSSYAGGLVGSVSLENDSDLFITNSFTAGTVTAIAHTNYAYAASGGLAGSISIRYNGSVTLRGCYATGDIDALWGSSCYYTYNCHLVGHTNGGVTVDDCYYYENQYAVNWEDGIHGMPCTMAQLNSISFYTDVLGWDTTIWKLSYLSFVSGKYPMLFAPIPGSSPEHVHTEETIPGVEPTYTEDGLTSGVRCSTCGEILVPQEIIPSLGSQDPANQVWDGSIATGFAGGSGTKEDPYLISTGAQLALLAYEIRYVEDSEYCSKYYQLTNSINLGGLEWEPIGYRWSVGSAKYSFRGHFDGNGYEVSNFKITRAICVAEYADDVALGLFGYADSAYIVNLGVTDLLIQVDAWCEISVGGLVGYAENVNITNCYTSGTIAVSSNVAADVGGLVGKATPNMGYNITATAVISNCHSSVDVHAAVPEIDETDPYSGTVYAGGLIGLFANKEINNCYAIGSVSAFSCETAGAGGLTGTLGGGMVEFESLAVNCYATGNVNALSSYFAYAGGLVGIATENGMIHSCHASGDVIAEVTNDTVSDKFILGPTAKAGGLAGTGYTIRDSYATGHVEATCNHPDPESTIEAGGLAGESRAQISHSYATGTVHAEGTAIIYIGGLIGTGGVDGSIYNCYAQGSVHAELERGAHEDAFVYAGGLAGMSYEMINSSSSGDVTVNCNHWTAAVAAGGLLGHSSSAVGYNYATMENCYATGNVTVTSSAGVQAGGLAGHFKGELTNGYAAGVVTITTSTDTEFYAGGLFGYAESYAYSGLSISNIYVHPTNGAPVIYAGMLFGIGDYSSAHNCYYSEGQILHIDDASNATVGTEGTSGSFDQFNQASFYTDVLGWDSTVWNLSNLDFANGMYPTLIQ